MPRFVMTKGLPGSGKSTWADREILNHQAGRAVRVNRDTLRLMLHAGRWKGDATEALTVAVRDLILVEAMNDRIPTVISDDTNLAPSVEEELRSLAERMDYEFVLQDFTDVPLKTCIERDLKRLASVGEAVIRGMYNRYLVALPVETQAPTFIPGLPSAVLVDVDGTVAKMSDRGPYDWARVGEDTPITQVVQLVDTLRQQGYRIIFISGRDGICLPATTRWLTEHVFKTADEPLFMRPPGDRRKDAIVKEEIYRRQIEDMYNVEWVVDDRDQVVEMWRGLGLTCLQVASGAF